MRIQNNVNIPDTEVENAQLKKTHIESFSGSTKDDSNYHES